MTPSIEEITDPAKLLDLLRTSAINTIKAECEKVPKGQILLFADNPKKAVDEWEITGQIPLRYISAICPVAGEWDKDAFGLNNEGILVISENLTTPAEWEDFSADDLVHIIGRIKQYPVPIPAPKAIIWLP